jgi:hypothetical protein
MKTKKIVPQMIYNRFSPTIACSVGVAVPFFGTPSLFL